MEGTPSPPSPAVLRLLPFILLFFLPSPSSAQTCGDHVWSACEWCGRDAYLVTGEPELDHDCDVDVTDFALFAQDYGLVGPGLSGDLDGNQWVTAMDFGIFVAHFGHAVPSCDPCILYAEGCGGTIRLTFTPDDPEVDDDMLTGDPGLYTAYVVVEDCPDLAAVVWGCRVSGNITIGNIHHEGLLYLAAGTAFVPSLTAAPTYVGGIQFQLLDTQPGWLEIVAVEMGGHAIEPSWSAFPPGRTMRFARVAHAGVNGAPRPDGTTCPSGCEDRALSGPRPAIRCVPNPAAGSARLLLDLPRSGMVHARICDPSGRIVRKLHDGFLASGQSRIDWNGRSDEALVLPSGIYFVQLDTQGAERVRIPLIRIR